MDNIIRNKVWIIVFLCVLLGVLGLIIFLLSPSYKGFSIHKTPYLSSNFATIQGESIYSYSGLSFYKSDLDKPANTTTLSSGFHLPVPETIHWAGDSGAVLTFTDQGATGSLVETELQSRGLKLDNRTMEFVWYFDFSSRTLRLVDEFGFASPAYYYSSTDQGFYYIKYGKPISESHGFEDAALTFYSTKSFSSKTISQAIGNEEATVYIGVCKDIKTICLIKDLNGQQSLYSVDNGKQNRIGETYNHLVATASPVVFVGSIYDKPESTPESFESAEDELLNSSYYVINPSTGKQTKVQGDRVANNSFIANTSGDDLFYIFEATPENDENKMSFLTGARDRFKTPKVKEVTFTNDTAKSGVPSSVAILDPISKNNTGFTLFRDVNTTYLITPQDFEYTSPKQTSEQLNDSLKGCFDKYTGYHDFVEELRQLKVGVIYDSNYRKNIEAFSSCVVGSSPQSQIGHDFIFVGISPFDGRFVTN